MYLIEDLTSEYNILSHHYDIHIVFRGFELKYEAWYGRYTSMVAKERSSADLCEPPESERRPSSDDPIHDGFS